MNKLKSRIKYIQDPSITTQDRMFRILVSTSLLILPAVMVFAALVGEGVQVVVMLGLIWFAVFLMTMFSVRTGKVNAAIYITGILIIFVALPVGFFFGGGVNGGSPVWFVFSFVYTCLFLSGSKRKLFLILNACVATLCYLLAGWFPSLVSGHSSDLAYFDSYSQIMLLSTIICVMIIFQKSAYEEQNRFSEEQKRKIIELNETQNHFFSSMSHEIRTPINTIIGLNEMTLREENLSDEVIENAINIQGASRILLSLINDILDMSKIESGQMAIVNMPYDTGAMLSEIVNMIWSSAKKKGLSLHVNVDPALPAVMNGDEVRIKQILINILSNAVKYTNEGDITLSVMCRKKDNDTVIVTYSVEDTGIGIRKESIPHLFSAFRRMDEDKNRYIEGTGLGLSIVKQLVDLMGGEITVDSIYTKGSKFVITLEQSVEDYSEIGEINLEADRTGKKRKSYQKSFEAPKARILVVDDNEVNLLVVKKLLRQTGIKVDTVQSGQECLKETMRISYDLIFMDHLMPGMDGVECLHAIRTQTTGLNRETPIIALTANAGSDMVAMYEREGFDDCLLKPVDGESIEKTVIKHLPAQLVVTSYEGESDMLSDATVKKIIAKRSVVITTESVCDLPEEVIKKNRIEIMNYSIHTEGGIFLDGIEINGDGVLSYLEKMGKNAGTMEPEVPQYIEFFARALESAQHVIHIAAGKGTSGAYPKAIAASSTFGNVTVINSMQMSCGLGLLVLKACAMVGQGMMAKDIAENIMRMRTDIHTGFLLDSTKYLKRNGRIPTRANVICEAFMLHPAVMMTPEGMRMKRLYPGRRNAAWKHYINSILRDPASIDKGILFIAYSGLNNRQLDEIEELVKKKISFEKIVRQRVSGSSAVMYGPGTFGLVFSTFAQQR